MMGKHISIDWPSDARHYIEHSETAECLNPTSSRERERELCIAEHDRFDRVKHKIDTLCERFQETIQIHKVFESKNKSKGQIKTINFQQARRYVACEYCGPTCKMVERGYHNFKT